MRTSDPLDVRCENYYIDSIRRHKYVEVLVNVTRIFGTPDGCRLPQQASVGRSCICYMSNVRVKQHPTLGILVCSDGHVLLPKSGKHPIRWTTGYINNAGYHMVSIKGEDYLVHRLIAEAFLPNPLNKPYVDHIDRCRTNNALSNLRWATPKENMQNTDSHEAAQRGYAAYGGPLTYKQFRRKEYYGQNREHILEKSYKYNRTATKRDANAAYNHSRSATHKYLKFQDGSSGWVPNAEAEVLLKLPVAQRTVPLRILNARQKRR